MTVGTYEFTCDYTIAGVTVAEFDVRVDYDVRDGEIEKISNPEIHGIAHTGAKKWVRAPLDLHCLIVAQAWRERIGAILDHAQSTRPSERGGEVNA